MTNINPSERAGLPPSTLSLTSIYPREGRNTRSDLCDTARTWLGVHQYFRDLLPRIDTVLTQFNPFSLNTSDFAQEISSGMQGLLGSLENHHRMEDHRYFPEFRRVEPRLGAGFDILDADHHFIHQAIDRLAGTTGRVLREFGGGPPTPGPQRGHLRDDLREELGRFQASLIRHLDDEEDLVIPLLLQRNGALPIAA